MLPEVVSHYRIRRRLGAGGMGEVFLADDLDLKRQVAIKLLTSRTKTDDQARKTLLREARAAASLDHPNICTVHEVGTDGDLSFIVMQFVEGETLAARLQRERLSPNHALQIVFQVADALAAAHREGVVHRDIKPQNIVLTKDDRVKVLDFGLARQEPHDPTGAEPTITDSVEFAGTPPYMAPEQLQHRPVDARTDLFALGAVYYECLTGRRAFAGRTQAEIAGQVLHVEPPIPSSVNDRLGPMHDRLCSQLLAKDPAKRVQTGEEAMRLLELALVSDSAAVTPASAPSPPESSPSLGWRSRVPRRRGAVLGAATVLVAALSIYAWTGWPSNTEPPGPPGRQASLGVPLDAPRVLVVLPLANLSGDPARDYLGVGFAETLRSNLGRLAGVVPVSQSETAEFANGAASTREMARNLGADFVVDGSFQVSGQRLLVTASLFLPDASQAWSRSYETDLSDMFGVQRDLSKDLSEMLELSLTLSDQVRLAAPITNSVAAFTDYATGRLLLDRGDIDPAVASLTQALQRDPDFALAHATLGATYWAQYRQTGEQSLVQKATASILDGLRLEPDDPTVRLSLARVYQGTGRDEAALDELDRVISSHPNLDEAYGLRARVLRDRGDDAAAVSALARAIEIRPNFWRHHNQLGVLHFTAGRLDEAITAWQRAADLQPENGNILSNLGAAHQRHGDLARALTNYQRSHDITPNFRALTNIGSIYYSEERYDDAIASYEAALDLAPPTATTTQNLAYAYEHLGRGEESLEAFSAAARLNRERLDDDPEDAEAWASLAVCRAKLGQSLEAIQHAERATELKPTSRDVLFKQGVVLALGGQLRQAVDALEKAIANGYSVDEVIEHTDLMSLRDFEPFEVLVSR